MPEVLKLNGYATAQCGESHKVPVWETSPVGPFYSWPSGGGGFEYFYGFIGGETNQYHLTPSSASAMATSQPGMSSTTT